jgi:catechol 2,3-dioxygenase-like lactoylglutathione lyase family enzyme
MREEGSVPFGHVHHVSITVTNLDRSGEWYGRVLGWEHIWTSEAGTPQCSVGALPDGTLLGFWTHGGDDASFDFSRIGLDHLAFGVDSLEELSAWEQRFAELEVPYSPPADAGPFGRAVNFKDPDGIALEIFVPAECMGA